VFAIDEKAVLAVAATNCASQRRRTVSADVDRWVWILNRAWLSVDACILDGVSRGRRVRFGPECFDCVDVLVGARISARELLECHEHPGVKGATDDTTTKHETDPRIRHPVTITARDGTARATNWP